MAENGEAKERPEISYEEKLQGVTAIAKPIATKSLAKKIYKVVKKAYKNKSNVINGLKNVQKSIRKGQKGIVILAGDITPIDMMCHLPAMCEDRDLPYCYVPSKMDLGSCMGPGSSERCCVSLMIIENPELKEAYKELKEQIKVLPAPV